MDGTNLRDETLTIYYDDKKEEEIALSWLMPLQEYTFDVSSASYVRFYLSGSGYYDNEWTKYGLADFKIDGKKVAKSHVVPEFETPTDFMHSAFNRSNYAIYDGSEKAKNFDINGKTYDKGIVLSTSNKSYPSYAQFNTEKLDKITFSLGHLDETDERNEVLTIVMDNKVVDEITLTPDMKLTDYQIDVSSAESIRLHLTGSGNYYNVWTKYALVDIQITEKGSLPGDTNGDGKLTVADSVLLARCLAEDTAAKPTGQGLLLADLNGDSILTLDDLSLLLKQLFQKD